MYNKLMYIAYKLCALMPRANNIACTCAICIYIKLQPMQNHAAHMLQLLIFVSKILKSKTVRTVGSQDIKVATFLSWSAEQFDLQTFLPRS